MALIPLEPALGNAYLVTGLLLGGVAAQLAALWKGYRLLLYAGTLAVVGAALLDRDPVLGVGQVLVFLALKERSPEKTSGTQIGKIP